MDFRVKQSSTLFSRSRALKLALFSAGLSGIVAEYIQATLATYFIGDSVFQWAIIVSLMMFAMGLGSRASRLVHQKLAETFIVVELILSLLVGFSSLIIYILSSYSSSIATIIYLLSITIGFLIGFEIPLAVRINDQVESLRINISSALENDYYGSLIGGLLFAFVGLPYLGITYLPFVLSVVNLTVALLLFYSLGFTFAEQRKLFIAFICVTTAIVTGIFMAKPITIYGEQVKYTDKVIFSKQSRYQKIVITEWKGNNWLYIDGNQQLSTVDEVMYHEPLVHPAMYLSQHPQDVLVLGGGDGCALREILKYNSVKNVVLVDLDSVMTNLGAFNPIMREMNKNSFHDPRVNVVNQDAFIFFDSRMKFYDVIIIDLPDPKTVELCRLYSKEFYKLCYKYLRPGGVIITQAGSPYFATKAFLCIDTTMKTAGFKTALMHNQLITLGEWGWVIGIKAEKSTSVKEILLNAKFADVQTRWIDNEAMHLMLSFGKNIHVSNDSVPVEINSVSHPILQHYYLGGNWDLY